MSTVQQLLDDVNLLYRNTFTTDQKLVWMSEEQRELFEVLELDAVPFSFSTIQGQYLYPIPEGLEIDRIKVITVQVNDVEYIEIPFAENDNRQYVSESDFWYTIVEKNFFINIPNGHIDGKLVYIYADQQPEDLTSSNLNTSPSVPVRYQELLKLGVLKRIARARKDAAMFNNYSAEYSEKLDEMIWKAKMQEPEFRGPIDVLPKRGGGRVRRNAQFVTLKSDSNGDNTWNDLSKNTWLSYK